MRENGSISGTTDAPRRLLAHWKSMGVEATSGVESGALDAFEAQYAVRVPDDLAAYLKAANGTYEYCCGGTGVDPEGFRFWPLSEMKRVLKFEPRASSELFIFADWREELQHYCVRMKAYRLETSPVYRYDNEIAPTFNAFVDLYVRKDVPLC